MTRTRNEREREADSFTAPGFWQESHGFITLLQAETSESAAGRGSRHACRVKRKAKQMERYEGRGEDEARPCVALPSRPVGARIGCGNARGRIVATAVRERPEEVGGEAQGECAGAKGRAVAAGRRAQEGRKCGGRKAGQQRAISRGGDAVGFGART